MKRFRDDAVGAFPVSAFPRRKPVAGADAVASPSAATAEVRSHRHRFELLISYALRGGVTVSTVLILWGSLMLLISGHTGYQSTRVLTSRYLLAASPAPHAYFPTDPFAILSGALAGKPFAIIEAGLLILLATPVFRVALSIVLFALERDWIYVLITTAVFLILMLSMSLGVAS